MFEIVRYSFGCAAVTDVFIDHSYFTMKDGLWLVDVVQRKFCKGYGPIFFVIFTSSLFAIRWTCFFLVSTRSRSFFYGSPRRHQGNQRRDVLPFDKQTQTNLQPHPRTRPTGKGEGQGVVGVAGTSEPVLPSCYRVFSVVSSHRTENGLNLVLPSFTHALLDYRGIGCLLNRSERYLVLPGFPEFCLVLLNGFPLVPCLT